MSGRPRTGQEQPRIGDLSVVPAPVISENADLSPDGPKRLLDCAQDETGSRARPRNRARCRPCARRRGGPADLASLATSATDGDHRGPAPLGESGRFARRQPDLHATEPGAPSTPGRPVTVWIGSITGRAPAASASQSVVRCIARDESTAASCAGAVGEPEPRGAYPDPCRRLARHIDRRPPAPEGRRRLQESG